MRDCLSDTDGTFATDAAAIRRYADQASGYTPIATPESTALFHAIQRVRMTASRARGGACVGGPGMEPADYAGDLFATLRALDIAATVAIHAQPEDALRRMELGIGLS